LTLTTVGNDPPETPNELTFGSAQQQIKSALTPQEANEPPHI